MPSPTADAPPPSTDRLLDDVAELVRIESPSSDPAAVTRCQQRFADLLVERTGVPASLVEVEGVTHLSWAVGEPRVLLLGHLDTVWPHGTLERLPFAVEDDRMTGPGVFDMKTGAAMMLHALAGLDDLDGMAVLLTGDEEVGAPTSRALIEDTARDARAVLVLEAAQGEAVKVARKGVGTYRLEVTGRAAHAGLEPEAGANALVELAHQVLAITGLRDADAGTTVTPTVTTAGTTMNTVPARAEAAVDSRAWTPDEQQRVDAALRALAPQVDGCTLTLHGGINRPPLTEATTRALFDRACRVAADLGLPPLASATVGGASDGNFAGALGVPTLDGLGAVGHGAHAEDEHVRVSALPDRTRLLTALCADLLARPVG
jgi:glutamate carboxypeptidase